MTEATPVRPTRRRRVVLILSLGGVLLLAAVGAWLGTRILVAQSELTALLSLSDRVQTAVGDLDVVKLDAIAGEFEHHASAAADATADPIWRAAESIPWAGPSLFSVRAVAEEADSLGTRAVAPLLSIAARMKDAPLLKDGRVDLGLLRDLAEPLEVAATSLAASADRLDSLDVSAVLPEVRDGVTRLRETLRMGSEGAAGAGRAAHLLPPLLGESGARRILLVLQNNAEPRTGGGLTGSFIELDADAGAISLARQLDSSAFRILRDDILPIPASDRELFGDVVGRFVLNLTMPSDFELSAKLASAWWESATGIVPDAVIAIDPLVIRSIVRATGSIPLRDGSRLTDADFVHRVLVEPYLELTPDEQTVFLQDVATATFDHLLSGEVSPLKLVASLSAPVEQGRVSIWSPDTQVESGVADTGLAGPRVRHRLGGDGAFAVYFNDATGAKMGSYLDTTISTATALCRADGRPDVVVAVRLRNAAPLDAGTAFPKSMTGGGQWGTHPGDIATNVSVAAPPGYFFGGVRIDGELQPSANVDDAGFPTSLVRGTVSPGEAVTLEFRFTAPTTDDVHPTILHTPLVNDPKVASADSGACP